MSTNRNNFCPKDEVEYNLINILEQSRVKSDEEIQEPEPILKIDGNTVFTLGNISLIMGKAKAKKSFTMALFTSIIAGNGSVHHRLFGNLPNDKKHCLYIDTEQHRAHVFKLLKRIMKISNTSFEMDNLYMQSFRPFNFTERVELIKLALRADDSIGLVVIDGIRDLIADINSAAESVDIVGLLMKLSFEFNCHICCVLHQNKGDDRARGHLGTELVNKAETIISVTKDANNPDYSIIKAEMTRDKEFDEIEFSINSDGIPVISAEKLNTKKEFTPLSCDRQFHINLLTEVFKDNCVIKSYNQAASAIKEQLQFLGFQVGTNKAKDFLSYYSNVTKQVIKVDEPSKGYMFDNQKPEINYKSSEFSEEVAPF